MVAFDKDGWADPFAAVIAAFWSAWVENMRGKNVAARIMATIAAAAPKPIQSPR